MTKAELIAAIMEKTDVAKGGSTIFPPKCFLQFFSSLIFLVGIDNIYFFIEKALIGSPSRTFDLRNLGKNGRSFLIKS